MCQLNLSLVWHLIWHHHLLYSLLQHYAHWKCVPPWCPTQSQAVNLQAGHSEPRVDRVHSNKVSPKWFCGECNSLVACTSSKASTRAWRSDIGTRELNNASGISSAVRYQWCQLPTECLSCWLGNIVVSSSYSSSRLKSCGWCISSLLTRKPPHAVRMSNKCGKCTKLWHLMATWNCSWW